MLRSYQDFTWLLQLINLVLAFNFLTIFSLFDLLSSIDAEIKAARRRMSTLNDKNGDIGDDIGGLSLDNNDDKVEVSSVVGFNNLLEIK